MKILLKKINKKGYHFLKSEEKGRKKVKLGSYSLYKGNRYIHLNFRKFYYYVKGGATFYLNRTYLRTLGDFDLFYTLYIYESSKDSKKIGQKRKKN